MAAVGYCRHSNEFIFFHGDNVRSFLGYGYSNDEYKYMGRLDLPMYCEREKVGDDKFYTFEDFYNQKLLPNGFGDTWLYPKYNIKTHFDDIDNNVPYALLSIKVRDDCNHVAKEMNKTVLDILHFVEMSESEFNEMVKFMEQKKYDTILIKNGLKIFLSPLDENKYRFCLFKGEPKDKHLIIAWKDRFKEAFLHVNIPNYYKKFIRHKYIGGTNGELFTEFFYDEAWRNFFNIEPIKYKSIHDIPVITDYDTLSCLSKEQKEIIEKSDREKAEQAEKFRREREENKLKDGYCDRCGAPNAHYCENPYMKEMYDRSVMQWLCTDCYYDCIGDI